MTDQIPIADLLDGIVYRVVPAEERLAQACQEEDAKQAEVLDTGNPQYIAFRDRQTGVLSLYNKVGADKLRNYMERKTMTVPEVPDTPMISLELTNAEQVPIKDGSERCNLFLTMSFLKIGACPWQPLLEDVPYVDAVRCADRVFSFTPFGIWVLKDRWTDTPTPFKVSTDEVLAYRAAVRMYKFLSEDEVDGMLRDITSACKILRDKGQPL